MRSNMITRASQNLESFIGRLYVFSEIFFSFFCDLPPSWSPLDKSYLEEIRLDDFLYRRDLFSYHRGKGRESDSASTECIGEMSEEFAVETIESEHIDAKRLKNHITLFLPFDLTSSRRVVAENLHIAIRDTRSPSRTLCYREYRSATGRGEPEDIERATHDLLEVTRLIEIEFHDISKSVTKWTREG